MGEIFTITSFIAELLAMHARGERLSLNDVERFSNEGQLLPIIIIFIENKICILSI